MPKKTTRHEWTERHGHTARQIGGAFLLGAAAIVVLLVGASSRVSSRARPSCPAGAERSDLVSVAPSSCRPPHLQQLAAIPRRTKLASDLQQGDVLHYFGVHVIERIEPLPGGYVGVHGFDGPVSGIPASRQVEVAQQRVAIPDFVA